MWCLESDEGDEFPGVEGPEAWNSCLGVEGGR